MLAENLILIIIAVIKKKITFNVCEISLLLKSWADRKNLSFEKQMELWFLKTVVSGYLPISVTQTTLELSLYRYVNYLFNICIYMHFLVICL